MDKKLKTIRRVLAAVTLTLITLLFVDVSGRLYPCLDWLAKIQFLPALLALNVAVVIALLVLTLVFGRIYCSVICPLGILQDLLARLNPKKLRFSHSPERRWLRWGVFVLFVVCLVAGIGSAVALIAPYSAFGRIAQTLLKPLWTLGNNALASIAENQGSYAFWHVDIWVRSWPTVAVAVVTLVVLAVLAWRGGRTWCNTICPVGTLLGLISRFSWLKVRFDTEKCRHCGRCEKSCKASAIDMKAMTVDASRCVVCGNCLGECRFDALHYAPKNQPHPLTPGLTPNPSPKGEGNFSGEGEPENSKSAEPSSTNKPDEGRRAFLVGAALAATGVALAQEKKKVDGGLAAIEEKKIPERLTPLTPPGSQSAQHMAQHCTGCQLCVAQCPNDVLRPATSLLTLMQPMMSYERGYCRPECNRCGEVCPTGAIRLLPLEEKWNTQIGHAVWVKKNCLPVTDGVECGNCERHCPVGAITMVPLDENDDESPLVPAVNESRCIGCGACENLCPARPFAAIYVEGHEVHRTV